MLDLDGMVSYTVRLLVDVYTILVRSPLLFPLPQTFGLWGKTEVYKDLTECYDSYYIVNRYIHYYLVVCSPWMGRTGTGRTPPIGPLKLYVPSCRSSRLRGRDVKKHGNGV